MTGMCLQVRSSRQDSRGKNLATVATFGSCSCYHLCLGSVVAVHLFVFVNLGCAAAVGAGAGQRWHSACCSPSVSTFHPVSDLDAGMGGHSLLAQTMLLVCLALSALHQHQRCRACSHVCTTQVAAARCTQPEALLLWEVHGQAALLGMAQLPVAPGDLHAACQLVFAGTVACIVWCGHGNLQGPPYCGGLDEGC